MTMKDNWPEGEPYPFGVHASHTWDELGAIFRVIQDFKINTFIELGLFKGGLSSFMLTRCQYVTNFYYVGVEKDRELLDIRLMNIFGSFGSRLVIGNVFHPQVSKLIMDVVMSCPVPRLVYCDNGDKPREVNTYLPIVPKGTYVMAHDWGTEITQHDLDMINPKLYVRHIPEYFKVTRLLLLEAV